MSKTFVVIGAGCAGLSACYTLCKYGEQVEDFNVILIEQSDHLGGHAKTVSTDECKFKNEKIDSGKTLAFEEGEDCDVGFMVCNLSTYPNMLRIFGEIGQEIEKSDMSFCIHDGKEKGFSWSFQENLSWALRNIWKPRLIKFLFAHRKFVKKAIKVLSSTEESCETVGEFCSDLNPMFTSKYLLPFVSAVWSVGYGEASKFAIKPFLRFMHNHRFLGLEPLQWFTPKNRSKSYVQKVINACGKKLKIKLNTTAVKINTRSHTIEVKNGEGKLEKISYAKLILASSAPIQAKLDPPAKEWLSKFSVSTSRVCGHIGDQFMSKVKNDWSSWNVRSDNVGNNQVAITYWISRIQNLKNQNILVTVNPSQTPDNVFYDSTMSHPVMDLKSEEAQSQAYLWQGVDDVYYCGAWLRHGFHEDGFHTGVHAAKLALGEEGCAVPLEFPTATCIMPPDAISGTTRHIRHFPRERKFEYPLHLFRFDTRFPPQGFDRQDHYGDVNITLDTQVRTTCLNRLGFWPAGRIECYCNLRAFGLYAFNPITPFFIHNEADEVIALVCEVHNTPWAERCIYAMHVEDDQSNINAITKTTTAPDPDDSYSKLTPAYHKKVMHVSPYHPAPDQTNEPTTSTWYYKFLLRGKEKLTVEVFSRRCDVRKNSTKNSKLNDNTYNDEDIVGVNNETDELRFTAVLDVRGFKSHSDTLGSLRTIWWVYYQALLMLPTHTMHFYTPPPVSMFDSKVYSWLFFMAPVQKYLHLPGHMPMVLALFVLSFSMTILRYTHSALFPLFWTALFAKLFIYFYVLHVTFQQASLINIRSIIPLLLPVVFFSFKNYPLYRNLILSFILVLACPDSCCIHGHRHLDL